MEIAELLPLTRKHWHTKIGLLVGILALVFFFASVANLVGMPFKLTAALIIVTSILFVISWFFVRKPPKTPANKIGFLVSIYCSNEVDQLKIKEDLLIPLKQHIQAGKTGKLFHFMELQQHHAELCLDQDYAQKIRMESGAHYMLFGRVRKRSLDDGKIHYFFELEGAVSHAAISEHLSKALAAEFTELLPRRVQIIGENDLFSFQFTSEWASLVAKYVIGIAAACSGDVLYAEQLFDDVSQKLNSQNTVFPIFAKLQERLPIRKAEIYEAMATAYHREWANTYDATYIDNVHSWLEKIDASQKNRPGVHYLYAICAFVRDRSIDNAINFVKKINENNNPVWHLNLAFLYGYKGDLKLSIRHYRAATQLNLEIDIVNQVEDFINWVIKTNPEVVQLHYMLGFFNWQIREDCHLAKENLSKFIALKPSYKFTKEIKLAETWLSELNRLTSTSKPALQS
jgi:tetratricopeptide (TPR) repeat protein